VGKLSLQTSPRVREGILGHQLGKERKGDGARSDNGLAVGKEGNARRSKSENSGIESSGGVSGKRAGCDSGASLGCMEDKEASKTLRGG
jgi:hypothetical protein